MSAMITPRKNGSKELSGTEELIIQRLAAGLSQKEIADLLGLRDEATRSRISCLRVRCHARTTAHLVAMYVSGKLEVLEAK